jgi:His/Glu/Gln/Arg/opine family amino acid ABC transporter permease subunit
MSEFDFSVIANNLPFLWQGLQLSLLLTGLAILGGIVLGTLLALMRLSGFLPLSLFAAGYVNLIRSVPLILVIFWFYFLVPLALLADPALHRPAAGVPQHDPDPRDPGHHPVPGHQPGVRRVVA